MKKHYSLVPSLPFFFVIFSTTLFFSYGQDTKSPTSNIFKIHKPSNQTYDWTFHTQRIHQTGMNFSFPIVITGILCFIAASISSAGGIGGGGLFIPILTIVTRLDLKTASSFSAFMVTGGSIANVMCNLFIRSPKFGDKCLINYDVALLSEPCMLLGVSIGVICNVIFPEWLITILFAIFLAWSTVKTCRTGVLCWKLESEVERESGVLENNGTMGDRFCEEGKMVREPLLAGDDGEERRCKAGIPWVKMGVLVLVWFSFFMIYLLRGNRNGQGIIPGESCGPLYWILSSLQIPLAIAFTSWILLRKDTQEQQHSREKDMEDLGSSGPSNKLTFAMMALLAGLLGGVFGIGGGMLISPLLLHVGIAPEVTAATCSFMVFFSSTMSALQYLSLGMEHTEIALGLSLICFVASLLGIVVVQKAIQEYGRASLIVFSVGIVMALSTVLITSFGAVDVWNNYKSGNYMGFKPPC